MKQKTVLITGAGGFIGKHVIKRSDSFRYQVVLTDDLSNLDVAFAKNHYYSCNLTKESQVKKIIKRIKGEIILLHLAAYVPKSSDKKQDLIDKSIDVNLKGTINLLNNIKNRLCKVCFASTLEVYGKSIYLPIDENHPTNPGSFYSVSKLMAEQYLRAFCKTRGVSLNILRFSSVYGPGELYDRAIPNFIKAALERRPIHIYGNGLDKRDYLYVDDAVSALIASVNRNSACRVFNIAGGKGHTIKNIANLIIKLSGSKSKIKFLPRRKDAYDLVFNISLAKKKIGFRPNVDIRQGLINEIDWFRHRNYRN